MTVAGQGMRYGHALDMDGTSGQSWDRPWASVEPAYIPAPILQVPVGYTAWLRRTGENGGAMRRRGGRGTTGARGMKRTTNGTGANARIAGLGTKGEAACRDSRSRGAVNVAFSTPR